MKNILKLNQKDSRLSSSTQVAYFLFLSIILLQLLAVMFLTNIGFDYVRNMLDTSISNASSYAGDYVQGSKQGSKVLNFVLSQDEVKEKLTSTMTMLTNFEDKASDTVKFKFIHFLPFVLAIFFTFIKSVSAFKKSLNEYHELKKRNVFLDILLSFIASIILLLIFFVSLIVPMLFNTLFLKVLVQFLLNFVLIFILYYLLLDYKKRILKEVLASVYSSVGILVVFYILKYLIGVIAIGNMVYTGMLYFLFFILSTVLVPYIIILASELKDFKLN